MAGLGGRREGAGRKPGVPNKASGVIKEAAQVWGMSGLERLAQLAGLVPDCPSTEPGATQVAAIRELLDRGYGKATQPIGGEAGGPIRMLVYTGVHRHDDAQPDENTGTDTVGC